MRSDGDAYPHRDNRDGTFDSICPVCFKTVARMKSEIDLEAAELDHVCDAVDIRKLRAHTPRELRNLRTFVEQQGEDSSA